MSLRARDVLCAELFFRLFLRAGSPLRRGPVRGPVDPSGRAEGAKKDSSGVIAPINLGVVHYKHLLRNARYVQTRVVVTYRYYVWLHSNPGNWKHDQQKLSFSHFDSYHIMCRYSSIRQHHPLLQAKRGHCRNYLANNHISQMLSSFSPLPCVRTHTGLPPSARPNHEGLVYPEPLHMHSHYLYGLQFSLSSRLA